MGCNVLPYLSQKAFGRAEHLSKGFAQICHLGREGSRTGPETAHPKHQNAGRSQALVTSWAKSKSKSASTVRHYVGHFTPRWKQAQLLWFHSHWLISFYHCKGSPALWTLAEEEGAPSSIALFCRVCSMFKITSLFSFTPARVPALSTTTALFCFSSPFSTPSQQSHFEIQQKLWRCLTWLLWWGHRII